MPVFGTNSVTSTRLCGIAVPDHHAWEKSKELQLSEATAAKSHPDIYHAVLTAHSVLWDNGKVLDYSFFGGNPTQQSKVDEVIQEWTWYANITFQRSTPYNFSATLRITFDPRGGSWSYVGNNAVTCVNDPTINLGWIGDDSSTPTEKERGVILHEFGHVLGLMHEHESPARSGVIRLKEAEVLQYYQETQGWDETTVRKQVLDVYSKESVSSYSRFDPHSIMMYFMPASMNVGGVEVPEVTELSNIDKAFIVASYPRPRPHPRAHSWSTQMALATLGASSDVIQAYQAATNIEEKRRIFSNEMADLRHLEAQRLEPLQQRGVQGGVQRGIQRGIQRSPYTREKPDDDAFVKSVLQELDLLDPRGAVHAPNAIEHAVQVTAHAEKVQNGILSLLLAIAPKVLLAPNIPAPGSAHVAHAVLDPNNLTLEHPVVQFGLSTFFKKLASNSIVRKAIDGAVKMAGNMASDVLNNFLPEHGMYTSDFQSTNYGSDAIQNAFDTTARAEKVQNGILSLLLDIAPKVLLAPNVPAPGSTHVAHAVLNPNNLTLEHPVVQFGLSTFFGKLASNSIVKKIMDSALKMTEAVGSGTLFPQHGMHIPDFPSSGRTSDVIEHAVQVTVHAEKVQNGILSLLLDIAPKVLLAPNIPAPGSTHVAHAVLDPNNLTLEHPVVQFGLSTFFRKLASNSIVKKAMDGAIKMAGNMASDALNNFLPEHGVYTSDFQSVHYGSDAIQNAFDTTARAEKVQNGILSLLLDIAPKVLLAPNVPAPGSTHVAHAALDPNNLTLEHPVVQFGLSTFFRKLASNSIVKMAMSGAVKMAGDWASEALNNSSPQHSAYTGLQPDQIARLVSQVIADPGFNAVVKKAVATAAADSTNRKFHSALDGQYGSEQEFIRRTNAVMVKLWEKSGPRGSEQILERIEQLL